MNICVYCQRVQPSTSDTPTLQNSTRSGSIESNATKRSDKHRLVKRRDKVGQTSLPRNADTFRDQKQQRSIRSIEDHMKSSMNSQRMISIPRSAAEKQAHQEYLRRNPNIQKERERIKVENLLMATRLLQKTPVIDIQQTESEFKKKKKISKKLMKEKQEQRKNEEEDIVKALNQRLTLGKDQKQENLELPNEEDHQKLLAQQIKLYLAFTKIELLSIMPINSTAERYYMEIKASAKQPRLTTPEMFDDFSKSVVNETFTVREIREESMLSIAIFSINNASKHLFLGDFELDLSPYCNDNSAGSIQLDLRNYRDLKTRPSYIPTDMRKRGSIQMDLKITSGVKKFLESLALSDEKVDGNQIARRKGGRKSNQKDK